jgi:tripartite-type tricarboxylate transporter receptor subunit TctC
VPHGTPADIVSKLNSALNETLRSPQVSERFKALNIESRQNTTAEFAAFVHEQTELWSKIVKEANITLG